MQKRDISKSAKVILDKFQIDLDSGKLKLKDIQEWCQEINALLNIFIQQVNARFLLYQSEGLEVAEEPIKPEDEVNIYS